MKNIGANSSELREVCRWHKAGGVAGALSPSGNRTGLGNGTRGTLCSSTKGNITSCSWSGITQAPVQAVGKRMTWGRSCPWASNVPLQQRRPTASGAEQSITSQSRQVIPAFSSAPKQLKCWSQCSEKREIWICWTESTKGSGRW